MGFSKIFLSGVIVFSAAAAGYGQRGGAVSTVPATPNPKAFERALPKQKHSHGMCARAVRVAVEELTGKKLERRDYAKEYGEPLLKTGCYVKSSARVQPRNYDVRILLPRKRSHCGHIEVFYRGNWYSDFRQPGSLWNVWPKEYARIQHYRFVGRASPAPVAYSVPPAQSAPRATPVRTVSQSRPVQRGSRVASVKPNPRSAMPARTTSLF
ncbi:hypothetical protein [Methylacidimicrobium sp. B4]|uniref:hypothetical protein n=1 Tax=Methylacidimicrobium sp. B4 TaxID=2796139 RepID=UPI001A8EC504|nr:hypothetical protein [Methylacidimicrobium sp. B4]QSR85110.1 hypothetical protein MacB4_02240 [Methylacidimicrobium sp. B4]